MIPRPPLSILIHTETNEHKLTSFLAYLESMSHIRLRATSQLPDDLTPYDVLVTFNRKYPDPTLANLIGFVRNGGGWLMLADLAENELPDIFGVQPQPSGPATELRVLFENADNPMAARLPDAIYLDGRYQELTKTADDTETILYTDWHYTHRCVMTHRRVNKGRAAELHPGTEVAKPFLGVMVLNGADHRSNSF